MQITGKLICILILFVCVCFFIVVVVLSIYHFSGLHCFTPACRGSVQRSECSCKLAVRKKGMFDEAAHASQVHYSVGAENTCTCGTLIIITTITHNSNHN